MMMLECLLGGQILFDAAGESGGGESGESGDEGGKKPAEGGDDKGDNKGGDEGGDEGGKAKTILEGGDEGGDDKKPAEGDDPWADMKVKIAGDDKKLMGHLDRYTTFETFAKAGLAAQERIRSGEFVKPLGEDADEKEVAEYRKANGIPEEAAGYEPPEIKGHEWTDADKPMLDAYREHMHGVNATKDQFNNGLEFYAKTVAVERQATFDKDTEANTKLEDDLRLELGPRFRGTINLMARYVGDDKEGFGSVPEIMEARLPDGRRLGDISDFVSKLAQLGQETYGEGAMISGHQADTMKSKKEEIQQVMKTDIDRYYAEGMDVEMSKILEREANSGRRVA